MIPLTPHRFASTTGLSALIAISSACTFEPPDPGLHTSANQWRSGSRGTQSDQDLVLVSTLGQTPTNEAVRAQIARRLAEQRTAPPAERTLIYAELGIAAAHVGALDQAAAALDEALFVMDATITDEEMARRVAQLAGAESEKVFRGEPHERAVCFLYRGLVYLADADYGNAKACFRQVELQDARGSASGATLGDWLSARHLSLIAQHASGDDAFSSSVDAPPEGLAVGKFESGHDTVVVVAAGFSPRKVHEQVKEGKFGLSYMPRPTRLGSVCLRQATDVIVDGALLQAPELTDYSSSGKRSDPTAGSVFECAAPSEDIYVQAVSRGRRDMDKVLEAKKRLEAASRGAAAVGEGLVAVGSQFGIFGLPLMIIGATVTMSERDKLAAANATADLRQINGVPHALYIGSFHATSGEAVLVGTDANGQEVFRRRLTVAPAAPGRLNVVLVRVYQ